MNSTSSTESSLIQKSLKYLAHRSRSETELRNYLASQKVKGNPIENDLIEQVIQQIKQFNLLNDKQFALDWTMSKIRSGKGLAAIDRQLQQKGITKSIIQQVHTEIEAVDIQNSAIKVAQKYALKIKDSAGFIRSQKMKKHLYSKGFSLELINQLIDDKGHIRVE